MEKELDFMIERFPQYRAKLIGLFGENEDFRSLCEDYWQCNYNLLKLTGKRETEKRVENNHKMLRLELEQEVLNFINF